VLGGQQGDGRVVGPHALGPVAPEVGQHGLLTVAHHHREPVPVRSAVGAAPHPDPVTVRQVDGGAGVGDLVEDEQTLVPARRAARPARLDKIQNTLADPWFGPARVPSSATRRTIVSRASIASTTRAAISSVVCR